MCSSVARIEADRLVEILQRTVKVAFKRKFSPGVNGILRQIKRLSHFGVSSEWLHGD